MIVDVESACIRLYFHCGWCIQVDSRFEYDLLYGGETLRMFDPGERREVYLSSMIHRRWDGRPFTVREITDAFPPKELTGLRYEHEAGELGGAALWMLGESDSEPAPVWVLMSMIACPPARPRPGARRGGQHHAAPAPCTTTAAVAAAVGRRIMSPARRRR